MDSLLVGGVDYAIDRVPAGDKIAVVTHNKLGFVLAGAYTEASATDPFPVTASASADQDPVFDPANATRTAVTSSSQTAITPPAGCKYLRLLAKGECFVRTDGQPAEIDAAGSLRVLADVELPSIPVTPGVAVTVVALVNTVLEATPYKAR